MTFAFLLPLGPDWRRPSEGDDSPLTRTALVNLMHLESGIKVDLIVRKSSEYRQVEFARRQPVAIAGVRTWIVSREDLILSKLVWALDTGSELQRRDIRQLLTETSNLDYIHHWAPRLGVASLLDELMPRATRPLQCQRSLPSVIAR